MRKWFLALVGLTFVKGTNVRKQVTKKVAKKASAYLRNGFQYRATLVGLTLVKSTSVVKGKR